MSANLCVARAGSAAYFGVNKYREGGVRRPSAAKRKSVGRVLVECCSIVARYLSVGASRLLSVGTSIYRYTCP